MTSKALFEADHLLRIDIPHLESQTAIDVDGTKRGGLGRHQFRDRVFDFRKAIERNARIQVMNVVIANVGGKPSHDWTRAQETRGFHGSNFIGPSRAVVERHTGEIVLCVEEIRANSARDEVRQDHRQ